MEKHKKKPIIVYAEQFHTFETTPISGVIAYGDEGECHECGKSLEEHGWIKTFEGGLIVCPNDWIIIGIKGEKYPVKPDVFKATYEKVDSI